MHDLVLIEPMLLQVPHPTVMRVDGHSLVGLAGPVGDLGCVEDDSVRQFDSGE